MHIQRCWQCTTPEGFPMTNRPSASSVDHPRPSAVSLADGLVVTYRGDATFIWLENPIPCAGCDELHCWFINRFGSTLCCSCDLRMRANHPERSRGSSPRQPLLWTVRSKSTGMSESFYRTLPRSSSDDPRPSALSPSPDLLSTSDRLQNLSNRTGLSFTQAAQYASAIALLALLVLGLFWVLP